MGTLLSETDESLRRVVARVALLNLTYFGVEFGVALAIGSVSLFADSIDFLEDTSVNFLILIALGWGARRRSHVGTVLAGILLVNCAALREIRLFAWIECVDVALDAICRPTALVS